MAVRRKMFGATGYDGAQPVQRSPMGMGAGRPQQPQPQMGAQPQGGGAPRRPVPQQGPMPGAGAGMMTPQNVQPFLQPGGGMGQMPQRGQGPVDQADILQLLQGAGLI